MVKTFDAFALRDFDAKKILQRRIFKQFDFVPNVADEETLKKFDVMAVSNSSLSAMETVIERLRELDSAVAFYRKLLNQHLNRLEKYLKTNSIKYMESDDKDFKKKYDRFFKHRAKYMDYLESVAQLNGKIGRLLVDEEKNIQRKYREVFASNLKKFRLARKMTQQDLRTKLGIAKPSFSQYENAVAEPSIKNLIRLADALNVSVDALLGRNYA